MGASSASSKSAGGQASTSLLDLPRNVRLIIYSYAVEPFVVFLLMQKRPERIANVDSEDKLAHSKLDKNIADSRNDQFSDFSQGPHRIPTLDFRVSTFSPLLVLNKQVSSEVSDWIESSGLQDSAFTTIQQCVSGDAVVESQAPDFARLFENSRLVLSFTAESCISFLQRLPTEARKRIDSVILRRLAVLFDDGPTRLAWSKLKTERYAAFPEALRELLPNLREIAIHIPSSGGICPAAPAELADMLQDGIVDTVRFLYEESHGARLLEKDPTLLAVQASECLACGQPQSMMGAKTLKRCSRCLKALYCSTPCQKANWTSHKAWCTQADASEKSKPQQDPRLPRFNAVLEEHIREDGDTVLLQTAVFPRNRWENYKTVIALRRKGAS